jgi:hypothetical protein
MTLIYTLLGSSHGRSGYERSDASPKSATRGSFQRALVGFVQHGYAGPCGGRRMFARSRAQTLLAGARRRSKDDGTGCNPTVHEKEGMS